MPESIVQVYDDAPIEGADILEFRLLYSGRLLGTSRTDTRAEMKHSVRRQFHPQLRRLWQINPAIRQMAEIIGTRHIFENTGVYQQWDPSRNEQGFSQVRFEAALTALGKQWTRNGYQFIPLVMEELCLRCSIEVLFLRPDEPKYVMQSGDLDAKVKTIFDALRMPDNLQESGGIGPQEDETPFYCLLQDDKLVS